MKRKICLVALFTAILKKISNLLTDSYISNGIVVLLSIYCIHYWYKKNHLGFMSYKQGLRLGTLTYITSQSMIDITNILLELFTGSKFLSPGEMEMVGGAWTAIDTYYADASHVLLGIFSLIGLVILVLVFRIITGLALSLVVSLFTKNPRLLE